MRIASTAVVLLCLSGCAPSIQLKEVTVAPKQINEPRTISLAASSSLHNRSIDDDAQLVRQLIAAAHRYLPQVAVVGESADLHVIVVLVDYKPGCAPKCANFPTYRNWSCTVLSRAPFAQAFALEGSTYNPFVSPTADCMRRLAQYLRENRLIPVSVHTARGGPTPHPQPVTDAYAQAAIPENVTLQPFANPRTGTQKNPKSQTPSPKSQIPNISLGPSESRVSDEGGC